MRSSSTPLPLRWIWLLAAPALLVVVGGCGNSEVSTHEIYGSVTYDGNPVPAGYIVFEPQASAGEAPGGQADIRDGQYRTFPGHGITGGSYVVHVYGFDGKPVEISSDPDGNPMMNPLGTPLFTEYSVEIDLPDESAQHDIAIPAQ